MGAWPGWWQHPRTMAQGSSLGRAQDVGPECLGSGQQRLGGAGSDGQLSMRVHTCASVFMCVHACVRTELTFPRSLLWGRGGMHAGEGTRDAESGRGPWLVSAAQGWIRPSGRAVPMLGAGLASSSSKHPLRRASAANLRCPPWAVPPGCARCHPRIPPGGRVPLSLAISSPFRLNALSFMF